MKGLLIKDIRLLGQQKKLMIIYLVMAIILGFNLTSTFLVTYFPMLGFFLALSTISLDNFDNGMAFLMTLPTNGKLYAIEKYVLATVIGIVTWACAIILQFGIFFIKKEAFVLSEELTMDLAVIPVLLIAIAVMIPVDIKYGTEKGRLMMFLIAAVAFVIFLGGKAIFDFLQEKMGLNLQAMIDGIKAVPIAAIVMGIVLITALICVGSVILSIRFMEKKEY